MSGPWDRPSSPGPDDLDWSPDDPGDSASPATPSEPWSPEDPWQESRRDTPGWDDWPPAAPPSDDYLGDPGPSADLWAEPWEAEAAAEPALRAPEPEAEAEAEALRPDPEPEPEAPEPAAAIEAAAEPQAVEPEPSIEAPVAEPWKPEPDPWGAAATESWTPVETDAPGIPEETFEAPPDAGSRPWSAPPTPADDAPILPDWLAEPMPEPEAAADAEPVAEEAGSSEPEPEVEVEREPVVDAEPASWLEVAPVAPPPFLPVEEPEPEAWPEFTAGAEPEAEAKPQAEIEPEDEPEPEAYGVSAWPAVTEPESEPEFEPESIGAPRFDDDLDVGDSTRVLPTSWEPPPPPERDASAELEPEAGEVRTALGDLEDADAEPASSTAEQAVPWLIGLILLLAGMVIVLLALIFAGDGSLGGNAGASASVAGLLPSPTQAATPTPRASASAEVGSAAPSATPVPVPVYGPLEMIYQGRAAALAPIYLLLNDFTVEGEPTTLAQDPRFDVRRFAWAPDGTVGAALLADRLVSIEIGESKRALGEGIETITFGPDASTVYAVRITSEGANDTAAVLAVDFESGDTDELASISYQRPDVGNEEALKEAQFTDDGGLVRLFWMDDGTLRLWVLGASTWTIDPADGTVTDLEGDDLPTLTDPDGRHYITLDELDDGTTILHYGNATDPDLGTTVAPGLVSHLRWSPRGDRVVFTVGHTASGGGVLQDLYLWNLDDFARCNMDEGANCVQITNTGAAFGAVWRGANARWESN